MFSAEQERKIIEIMGQDKLTLIKEACYRCQLATGFYGITNIHNALNTREVKPQLVSATEDLIYKRYYGAEPVDLVRGQLKRESVRLVIPRDIKESLNTMLRDAGIIKKWVSTADKRHPSQNEFIEMVQKAVNEHRTKNNDTKTKAAKFSTYLTRQDELPTAIHKLRLMDEEVFGEQHNAYLELAIKAAKLRAYLNKPMLLKNTKGVTKKNYHKAYVTETVAMDDCCTMSYIYAQLQHRGFNVAKIKHDPQAKYAYARMYMKTEYPIECKVEQISPAQKKLLKQHFRLEL